LGRIIRLREEKNWPEEGSKKRLHSIWISSIQVSQIKYSMHFSPLHAICPTLQFSDLISPIKFVQEYKVSFERNEGGLYS
jgi:hypothetical protein